MSTLVEAPGERGYTRGEELANTVSAATGFVVFAGVAPFVILTASRSAQPWAVTSTAIFLGSIVALYFTSTLYHALPPGRTKRVVRLLDHPFCARPARCQWRSAAHHCSMDYRCDGNSVQTGGRDPVQVPVKPDLFRHGMAGHFLDQAVHRERHVAGLSVGSRGRHRLFCRHPLLCCEKQDLYALCMAFVHPRRVLMPYHRGLEVCAVKSS
jgi:Haemolysin-III related